MSGCGKSSLIKAVIKFISIDGIAINDIALSNLKNDCVREKVSYISQSVPIMTGTIRTNILLGRDVPNNKLDDLLNKTIIKKFTTLEHGLDTEILENGSNLSGGDKQRIALARIYLEDPEVTIFDEVTSSLDKNTAKLIIDDLLTTFHSKIIFFISHDIFIESYCNKKFLIKIIH